MWRDELVLVFSTLALTASLQCFGGNPSKNSVRGTASRRQHRVNVPGEATAPLNPWRLHGRGCSAPQPRPCLYIRIQSKTLSALHLHEAGVCSMSNTWAKETFPHLLGDVVTPSGDTQPHTNPMPQVPWEMPSVQRPGALLHCSLDPIWMRGEQGCRVHRQPHVRAVQYITSKVWQKELLFSPFHALPYLGLPLLHLPKRKIPSKCFLKSQERLSMTHKGAELGHVCSVQLLGNKSIGAVFLKAGPSPPTPHSKQG